MAAATATVQTPSAQPCFRAPRTFCSPSAAGQDHFRGAVRAFQIDGGDEFTAGFGSHQAKADPLLDIAVTQRARSETHTSELQSLMRNSYAVFCLKKKNQLTPF